MLKRLVVNISFCTIFFTMILLFQNCEFKFFPSSVSQVVELKSGKLGGNGEGYAGLQKNTFYKFEVGFTCMGNETAQSIITRYQDQITYKSYSHLLCEQKTETLNLNQIDQSKFQNDILGYQDGVYVGLDAQPDGIPADLVEVWCQSLESKHFLETISYYNRFTKKSMTRMYYSETDPYLSQNIYKNDFDTTRLIESNSVTMVNAQGFSLLVDRLQLLPGLKGQYAGKLSERNTNFSVADMALRCRFGGALDSSVWPAQRLVDLNFSVNNFWSLEPPQWFFSSEQKTEENNFFYKINASQDANEYRLFKLDLAKAQKKIVDNQLLYKSTENFLFEASDSALTIQLSRPKVGNKYLGQLLQLNLNNYQLAEITQVAAINGFLSNDFQILPNNQVLFSEWIDPLSSENFGTFLKIYDPQRLKTSVIDLNENKKTTNKLGYLYQKKFEQIFITQYNENNRPEIFYKYKLSSAELENFTPSFLKWPWSIGMVDIFNDPESAQMIRYSGLNFRTGEDYKFMTSFDGSKTITMPADSLSIISSDGQYVFFNTIKDLLKEINSQPSYNYVVNTSTNETVSIGPHSFFESFFTKDSQWVIAHFRQNKSPFSRVLGLNVHQPKNQKEICSTEIGSAVSSIAFDVFKDSSFLLMALNTDRAMVYFYKVNQNQQCQLLNSITSKEFDESLFELLFTVNSQNAMTSFKSYFELKMSPDESGFVFGIRNKPMDIKKPRALAIQKLIYVPVNGQASYVINTPLDPNGFIDDFRFLNDSRTVLFIGNQVDREQHNIFMWQIPKPSP